ncbi:hypothetical protein [Spirosoma arcticum]
MAAIVFKAQLVDETGNYPADFVRILFGADSLEEKEKSFREICKQNYPDLTIEEPITIATSKLG